MRVLRLELKRVNYINRGHIYCQLKHLRGHPFMTSKKIRFLTSPLPLSTCVHMSRTPPPWTSTGGRHKIHIALLKRLAQSTSPDLKLKFDYMIVIYLKL